LFLLLPFLLVIPEGNLLLCVAGYRVEVGAIGSASKATAKARTTAIAKSRFPSGMTNKKSHGKRKNNAKPGPDLHKRIPTA
jgi:hypothetical protein